MAFRNSFREPYRNWCRCCKPQDAALYVLRALPSGAVIVVIAWNRWQPGLPRILRLESFVLFQNTPNPFTEYTNIQFNTPNSDNVVFEVIDMFGRSVYIEQITATKGLNTYQFSYNFLSAGIYMYNINNGKESISKRMIVTGR